MGLNRMSSMGQSATTKPSSPLAPDPAVASWLVSAILSDGQILKFDINRDAPYKIVGRDPNQADVVIADDAISRAHARIEWRDGDLWVADLKSTNGTKVGNRAVGAEPQRLYPSDKLQLGPVVFTISTA
ncbi:MAG: FHA domain-containing protein [Rhodopseudomonas sp.]|nr:FHA domain-containing protein [Rhodopseudomonas sp.]